CGLEVDADLVDRDALLQKEALGRLAKRAGRCAVHQYFHFSTGSPACCQAARPPERFATRVKPCFFSDASAFAERSPPSQYTITGRSFFFARSAPDASSRASGRFFAPSTWPAANSFGSRTSTTSASSRLMSCVACVVFNHGPPVVRRTNGHSSIPPE